MYPYIEINSNYVTVLHQFNCFRDTGEHKLYEPLKQVTVSKYLGLKIDSNLKWDDHINAIIPNISSEIGILRSLKKIAPIETLKPLYNAIVQPHFDYSDIVYDSASKTNKDRLQKLQTRACRLITG